MVDIRVPTLGESVTEATVGKWFKKPGEAVAVDEPLVELETDKVTIEVPSPAAGVLADIAAKDGDTVAVGALIGRIKEGAGAAASGKPESKTAAANPTAAPKRVRQARLRLRVDAAFLAERERSAAGRLAAARPPRRPPLREEAWLTGWPRPEPLFLPPPVSLLTVAQARRSASLGGTPRSS